MITIINNDEMKISVSKSFTENDDTPDKRSLSDYILEKTKERFDFYRELFNKEKLDKIEFMLFDNYEEWKEFYTSRNHREPPEYSRGCFESENNLCYSVQKSGVLYSTPLWFHTISTNAHEAFHIYYKKYIYKDDRVVWFDEGLAQYLSGEDDLWINNEEKLKKVFLEFYQNYKEINNLNDRIQGNNSIPDDLIFSRKGVFEGYKMSLLAIKYLDSKYGISYIKELMKYNKEIRELGTTIIDDMIEYYKERFNIKVL